MPRLLASLPRAPARRRRCAQPTAASAAADAHAPGRPTAERLAGPAAFALLTGALLLTGAAADYTIDGCLCLSACSRTWDSPFTPWCDTSYLPNPLPDPLPPNTTVPCGQYSPSRNSWWAQCIVNANNTNQNVGKYELESMFSVWAFITLSALAGVAVAYGAVCCTTATRAMAHPWKTGLWLPPLGALAGAAHGLIVGGTLAVCLGFMYMTLPYPIELAVAVTLGLSIAALLVLPRVPAAGAAPHAAAYME